MDRLHYLIFGGGIAGTTAAETIRKEDGGGSIVIISDEPYRLYSRIMLSKPNFFLGKIPFEQIWLKKESWYGENNVKLITGRSAVQLDAAAKIVSLDDQTDIEYLMYEPVAELPPQRPPYLLEEGYSAQCIGIPN